MFSPDVAAAEVARGSDAVVPTVMAEGWRELPSVSSGLADVVMPLLAELLGAMMQFGWEKALGGPGEELSWWEDRALRGAQPLR